MKLKIRDSVGKKKEKVGYVWLEKDGDDILLCWDEEKNVEHGLIIMRLHPDKTYMIIGCSEWEEMK